MAETMNDYKKGKVLVNPDASPIMIVLTGTSVAGAGTTSLFVDDSCGLASQLGLVGGAAGVQMTASNGILLDNIKKMLQTYALVVSGFNFDSTDATQLTKNLKTVHPVIDGDSQTKTLFSALQRSNMQFDPKLLNLNFSFVWTALTALTIPIKTVAGGGTDITFTFTLSIQAMVPYADLDNYLSANPIMANPVSTPGR